MKNFTRFYFIFLIIPLVIISCNDDDDNERLKLTNYTAEVNFGKSKFIAVKTWQGDRTKITVTAENDALIIAEVVNAERAGEKEDIPYVEIFGTGNGETSVTVKDEKGNQAVIRVKAVDDLADFKADDTVHLLLEDEQYKINLRKGDSNGGTYTFGREGDVVTFRWENEDNGKSATITYTETSEIYVFATDVKTDAILTLINPDAEKESDREITIELPYLKVIGTQGKLKEPQGGGYAEFIAEKAWIIFRLPPREGQERGTLGYCIGSLID